MKSSIKLKSIPRIIIGHLPLGKAAARLHLTNKKQNLNR